MGDAAERPDRPTIGRLCACLAAPGECSPVESPSNIIVMGPRASGKTTVGRGLAQRLNRDFVDLDMRTRAAFPGCSSVAEIWRRFGEPRWREAEATALEAALQQAQQVIALGGGTPMIPAAQRLLADAQRVGRAFIVYLDCGAAVLRERLRHEHADRPPLLGRDAVDEVEQVLRERRPAYLRLADVALDGAGAAEGVVGAIIARLNERAG